MRQWIRKLLLRLIRWAAADEFQSIKDAAFTETRRAAASEVDRLKENLAQLVGVDASFHEVGHLVLLVRCNGRDIVRVIQVPRNWRMQEYIDFCKMMEGRFGVRQFKADLPHGMPVRDFLQEIRRKTG